jgi:hypothetical protein
MTRKPSLGIALPAAVIAASAVMAFAAAGCGKTVVKESSEEDLVTNTFQKQGLPAPESIDCPDDVDAKVGETFDCKVIVKGGPASTTLTLTGKVTKVTDKGVLLQTTDLKRAS